METHITPETSEQRPGPEHRLWVDDAGIVYLTVKMDGLWHTPAIHRHSTRWDCPATKFENAVDGLQPFYGTVSLTETRKGP